MPIFDFKCKKCHHLGEQMLSFVASEKPSRCPKCAYMQYNKVMPSKPPHVTYRGPGWTGRIK